MRRALHVRTPAAAEFEEATEWYESQRSGLGVQFSDCIDDTPIAICQAPERFPIVLDDVRQALVSRFPYVIFFVVGDKQIDVIAIVHARRDPTRWQSRI